MSLSFIVGELRYLKTNSFDLVKYQVSNYATYSGYLLDDAGGELALAPEIGAGGVGKKVGVHGRSTLYCPHLRRGSGAD